MSALPHCEDGAPPLLDDPTVKADLEQIRALASRNRMGRRDGHISRLDRFFWLTAFRGDKRISFRPSGTPSVDDEGGHWICNLVLRGGGTLGLAHVGFVVGLEAAGIRFAGLAGASAGSIVALGVAAARGDDLLKRTSEEMVRSTGQAPMDWFIDGPRPVRMLIKHVLRHGKKRLSRQALGLARAVQRLLRTRGLNQGERFEQWLAAEMAGFGVPTLDLLERRLAGIHDTLARAEYDLKALDDRFGHGDCRVLVTSGSTPNVRDKAAALLKMIASAMPIGVKFVLPEHTKYLEMEPALTSPARLVRMSMAIPLFFDPVRIAVNRDSFSKAPFLDYIKNLSSDRQTSRAWEEIERLTFIDGGVFSNLPLDAFETVLPDLPTILVPVGGAPGPERFRRSTRPSALIEDAIDCIQAMRFQRDVDSYLRLHARETQFEQVARQDAFPRSYNIAEAPIDTGDANWLNFVMSETDKRKLFRQGVRTARLFLEAKANGSKIIPDDQHDLSGADRYADVA